MAPPRALQAQTAAVDKDAKKKAAARFKEGEALFQKHAYSEAGQAFEDAYAIAPHPAVMLNAINAWSLAGQPARAASLAARLISDPATDDRSREEARSKMADLQTKVGRLNIRGPQVRKLTLDGRAISLGEVFVDPGDHLLEAEFEGQKPTQRKVSVVAGSSAQILLDGPTATTAPTPTSTAAPTSSPSTSITASTASTSSDTAKSKGWSPVVVYVGAGVTAVLGGVSIWSGLDTLKAKDEFDKNPNHTDADKQDGIAKQNRTNVLIGATALAGVATVGIALFFTDWKGSNGSSSSARLRLSPSSFTVEGTF